jgi:ubiquinone/menaquinone biosynthesis C-methylase UbiE
VKDQRLRAVFDEIADLYDRARPNYPEELFDALVETTTIDANSRLLEIAPGTGQATLSLAKRRFNITAIELSSRMSAIARKHLRDYGAVQVITGAFEDADLPDNSFDLVYVATAFHWISPDAQFQKPHRILKSNGHLAVILGSHISGGDNRFFEATQPL